MSDTYVHTQQRAANGTMVAASDDVYWRQVSDRLTTYSERVGSCLLWRGPLSYAGYGLMSIRRKTDNAHRAAYRAWVGEIPEGLEIDHLCRVRNCIEPTHLEAVTRQENLRRMQEAKTHCVNGHEFAIHATVTATGRRRCRPCKAAQAKAYKAKQRETGK